MDTEKLICLVQEYPVLYNTNHPEYMRAKLKDEVWGKIGAELEFEGEVVKAQWLKVRECHREALRRQKKKAAPTKPWTYQKQMEFLLPFMKNRCATSNTKPGAAESAEEEEVERELEEPLHQSDDALENEAVKTEYVENPTKKCRKENVLPETDTTSISITMPTNNPVEQFIKHDEIRAKQREDEKRNITNESETSPVNDALYHFFRFMYSTTKQLPPSYQRSIRSKIFKIVTDAEEQYETNKSFIEDHPNIRATEYTPSISSTSTPTHSNLNDQFPDF